MDSIQTTWESLPFLIKLRWYGDAIGWALGFIVVVGIFFWMIFVIWDTRKK